MARYGPMDQTYLIGRLVLALFVASFISSCRAKLDQSSTQANAPAKEMTAPTHSTDESLPIASITPSLTAPAPVEPLPASTLQPSGPISQHGPWFMYADQAISSGKWNPAFMNIDGSGYGAIEAPLAFEGTTFGAAVSISARGGHIALLVAEGYLDYQIWIFRLPDLELIRRIPLLSPEAKHEIAATSEASESSVLVPASPILSTLGYAKTFAWSPNGRFLAFAAALDDVSLDLYIYDFQLDSYHRLTTGPDQAALLDWSPDSRWIVHMSILGAGDPWTSVVSSVWAASSDGSQVRYLFSPSEVAMDILLFGWTSDNSFLSGNLAFESAIREILDVDIQSGQTSVVFPLPSLGAAYDPMSNTLVANVSGFLGSPTDMDLGLYLLDLDTGESRLAHEGEIYGYAWEDELGVFTFTDEEGTIHLMAPDGTQALALDYVGLEMDPSPDGTLFVVSPSISSMLPSRLYTLNGSLIRELQGNGSIIWAPDSNAFIRASRKGLYIHRRSHEWAGTMLDDSILGPSHLTLINP